MLEVSQVSRPRQGEDAFQFARCAGPRKLNTDAATYCCARKKRPIVPSRHDPGFLRYNRATRPVLRVYRDDIIQDSILNLINPIALGNNDQWLDITFIDRCDRIAVIIS